MDYKIIDILKPLYETAEGYTVGIYDKNILDAIKNNESVVIRTEGEEQEFDPKWIRDNCPTFEKVYLRPTEPMRLYKIFLKKKTAEEKEKDNYYKYNLYSLKKKI